MQSITSDMTRFSIQDKTEVEHQKMMGLIVDAKWGDKKWLGMWGKLIKSSGIHLYDLERLIRYAVPKHVRRKIHRLGGKVRRD